jgi:hypothetical protein
MNLRELTVALAALVIVPGAAFADDFVVFALEQPEAFTPEGTLKAILLPGGPANMHEPVDPEALPIIERQNPETVYVEPDYASYYAEGEFYETNAAFAETIADETCLNEGSSRCRHESGWRFGGWIERFFLRCGCVGKSGVGRKSH